MMTNLSLDPKKAAQDYLSWMNSNHQFIGIDDEHLEVQTPFIDTFGDSISLLVTADSTSSLPRFKVTDQGYTIWNLEAHGINLSGETKKRIMTSIIEFGQTGLNGDEICILTTKKHLAQSIHELTQVLLKVSSLGLMNNRNVSNIFFNDVENYFEEHKDNLYRFARGMAVPGKNGILHQFDYQFITPKKSKMVKTYKNIGKSQYTSILGINTDIIPHIQSDSIGTGIVYDGNSIKDTGYLASLADYGIDMVDFNDKDLLVKTFGKGA